MFSIRRTLAPCLLFAAVAVSAHAQAPGELPAAPAKALVQKTCTSCHVATQVTSRRKTEDQWEETVEKMVGYGAKVGSDADFDAIVSYLTRFYGPANGGAAASKR